MRCCQNHSSQLVQLENATFGVRWLAANVTNVTFVAFVTIVTLANFLLACVCVSSAASLYLVSSQLLSNQAVAR